MTTFVLRGLVVSRVPEILSTQDVELQVAMLADYYGVLDSEITVFCC